MAFFVFRPRERTAKVATVAVNAGPSGAVVKALPFAQAMQRARELIERSLQQGSAIFSELHLLEKRISGKTTLQPRELLGFQIKAQDLGLRVELLTKVVESGTGALKRLQSAQ